MPHGRGHFRVLAGESGTGADCLAERTGFERSVPPIVRESADFFKFRLLRGEPALEVADQTVYKTRLKACRSDHYFSRSASRRECQRNRPQPSRALCRRALLIEGPYLRR